jgi:hypothetical protein
VPKVTRQPIVRRVRARLATLRPAVDPTDALNLTHEDRERHLAALADALHDESVWRAQAWMHHNLNVLDVKANAALQFNAILLAAITFLAAQPGDSSPVPRVALVTAVPLIVWVIWNVSRFNWVYWSSTSDLQSPDVMLNELLRLRETRTRVVRISYFCGTVSLLLVSAVLVGTLTGAFHAPDASRARTATSGVHVQHRAQDRKGTTP